MSNKNFGLLSSENTAPFILVSLTYFFLLGSPFIYFSYLKGQPHTSKSASLPATAIKKNNQTDSVGEGQAQLNKFDDGESSTSISVAVNNLSDWTKDADSRGFILLTKIAIFSVITAFGSLGAAVSLITRTRNGEPVLNNINIFEILSVQTIGAIFACILGLAFMGNMLGGTLFPNPSVFYRILYIPSAFAKLLVLSFIAGFSERFVPNILNNFIKKVEEKDEQDTTKTSPNKKYCCKRG